MWHQQQPKQQTWILRVHTDSSRLRLQLSPHDQYQKVLDIICQKLECQEHDMQVYSPNGRKLNIAPQRRIKDVVYLGHGATLQVRLTSQAKSSALRQRTSFLSADSKFSLHTRVTPPKLKCTHPDNVRCIHCSQNTKIEPFTGSGQMIDQVKGSKLSEVKNSHGPSSRCVGISGKGVRSADKAKQFFTKVRSPSKINNPELEENLCRHKPSLKCSKCKDRPSRIRSIALLKQDTPIKLLKSQIIDDKTQKQQKKQNKCNHGQYASCTNCTAKKQQNKKLPQPQCNHSPGGRCFNCILKKQKPAHVPFDQYLHAKKSNCSHSPSQKCPNCLPQTNLRLVVDKKCKRHEPYPAALCSNCRPQNVSIKTQQFRHVDYVQFMNSQQIHGFIDYWLKQREDQMRIGFLYGYFAQDPHYPNGIRAIVESVYEPHQYCTMNEFWILDSQQRKQNIDIVAQSAGLEKIGMIVASTNTSQTPFTQGQIRAIAKLQQMNSVTHSTGYKLSNYFTVLIRKDKKAVKQIEPQVLMVSDQGQALEQANMFVPNKKSVFKMQLRDYDLREEIRPIVYVGGKQVNQFQIEYLLVKVASGVGKNKQFSIMKSNLFPPSSRGAIKKQEVKNYLQKTKHQSSIVRFGDLNLLLFIAEMIDISTAMQIGRRVREEEEVDCETVELVEATLANFAK